MDRILLAEDDPELIEEYKRILESSKFDVVDVSGGDMALWTLEKLGRSYFDVFLSDTELENLDGPDAVRSALEKNLLDDSRTLIIGMSSESENQQYWGGLAHLGCFYDKVRLSEGRIANVVKQCLRNFRSGGLWKEKLPQCEED